jgi:hypothetical protein
VVWATLWKPDLMSPWRMAAKLADGLDAGRRFCDLHTHPEHEVDPERVVKI